MFDVRFYNEAENKLNERRLRGERLLAKREEQVAEKNPELLKIQRDLSMTSARLIELILSRGDDFERKLSELEQNNLLLQERLREGLQKNGYPPDFLDTPYECPLCRDRGTVNGKRCSCFMNIVRQLAAEELNRSSPLNLCDFGDFDLRYYDSVKPTPLGCTAREAMKGNFDFCRDYAENFHIPCKNIFMRGATGLGKTHLSLSIANEVLKKGYNVIYGSAPDLFRKIEREHFERSSAADTAEALQNAQLLIIDDLGAEFESKFYTSALYSIVNNRMNAALPTIVSTNCDLGELRERYGERVASRLASMEQLIFVGNDVRIMKANSY